MNSPEEPAVDQPATDTRTGMHPALVATAIALPVALVVGVIVAAVIATRSPVREPVVVGAVPAPQAESAQCGRLLGALPESYGDYSKSAMAEPAPAGAAAWQSDAADPIVLRCGLGRPTEFDQASPLNVVDGVQWFQVSGADQGLQSSTWYVVDREVYVAVTIPDNSGPTPLQSMSGAVNEVLPQTPIDPNPVGG